jgi:type II secretory pathway component PulK
VEKSRVLRGLLTGCRGDERGVAIIVVLLAIAVLLPPTLVLASLAIKWQRQALDYRDSISEEFAAHAGFEKARTRIAANSLELEPDQASSFVIEELEDFNASVRVARQGDIVLTQGGRIMDGTSTGKVDLELTGIDAEGRVVYQYRKLAIYTVQVDVSRRPTLPAVRLYGTVAVLPEGELEVLGLRIDRGYFE